ncbi:MAG: TonB-dependent receptor plug domain-containing protein [Flavobacteriaceae bacterium]|nr:MAG: TonB-dependent receptor plug domain-containing protein [Flavobacteriaceae bacterium]
MKKQYVFFSMLSMYLVGTKIVAQNGEDKLEVLEEVIISATKFESKKENTGKVVYKITQKDILNNAGKTVLDMLNTIPGIEIRGTNTNSSEPRSTYIRGGRSRQVLVLIDGVPVSDPSGIDQEYDLRLLSLNQIESIEILKGASSTLYGTGAATGVINIRLKKASKKQVKAVYEANLGTNNTANIRSSDLFDRSQNLNISGILGDVHFLASYGLAGTDGMSSARSNTDTVFEDDLYTSNNGFFKLGYKFNDKLSLESFLNFDEFKYDYDAGNYVDSDVNNGLHTQLRIGVRPRFKYTSGEFYILVTVNKIKRTNTTTSTFVFEGRSTNIDLVNKINFPENKLQLITGFNYQEHSNYTISPFGNIDKEIANFSTKDPYLSLVYIADYGLSATIGGRLNVHSLYGNHFVYDANISYKIINDEKLKIRALSSYSTAFIAPSTYQLFSDFGNTSLQPETSKTIEFGLNSSFKNVLDFSIVYFNREEKDAFIFQSLNAPPFGVYINSGETLKVNGIESEITIKLPKKIQIVAGYTYTNKKQDIDYIPKNKLIASVEVSTIKKTFLSLVYKNTGGRLARYFDANTFATASQDLPVYQLLDINMNHKILDGKVTLFGSVTNLFNEDYEDILGYSTRGRNYKFGLRLQL